MECDWLNCWTGNTYNSQHKMAVPPLCQSLAISRYEMKYRRSWITNETMKTGGKRGSYNQPNTKREWNLLYIEKASNQTFVSVSFTNTKNVFWNTESGCLFPFVRHVNAVEVNVNGHSNKNYCHCQGFFLLSISQWVNPRLFILTVKNK